MYFQIWIVLKLYYHRQKIDNIIMLVQKWEKKDIANKAAIAKWGEEITVLSVCIALRKSSIKSALGPRSCINHKNVVYWVGGSCNRILCHIMPPDPSASHLT